MRHRRSALAKLDRLLWELPRCASYSRQETGSLTEPTPRASVWLAHRMNTHCACAFRWKQERMRSSLLQVILNVDRAWNDLSGCHVTPCRWNLGVSRAARMLCVCRTRRNSIFLSNPGRDMQADVEGRRRETWPTYLCASKEPEAA
jgi:hypothetical protein